MKDGMQLNRPVTEFLSGTAFTLREDFTIDQALEALRSAKPSTPSQSQVMYFYVVNAQEKLVGVLPARNLVLSPGNTRVSDIMMRQLIMLHQKETLFDALELFAMHRLLAIPVVNDERKFLGLLEVSLYTDEVFDLAQNRQLNEVFQLVGLHLEQHKQGAPWKGFKLRMPWLLSNITGGLICAALGSLFEATVQKVVLIALFIPLILTLAESIAVQSMTLSIEQSLARRKFSGQVGQEIATALLLGACSGIIVGVVSLFWRGPLAATFVIAGAICAVMMIASTLGQTVPKVIHALKLNPRIASGPVTLAVVDIAAITVYLGSASMVLGE